MRGANSQATNNEMVARQQQTSSTTAMNSSSGMGINTVKFPQLQFA